MTILEHDHAVADVVDAVGTLRVLTIILLMMLSCRPKAVMVIMFLLCCFVVLVVAYMDGLVSLFVLWSCFVP